MIRQLHKSEYPDAITLSLKVFMKCGDADFDDNGLSTFKSFIYNQELMNELTVFGAFEENTLIGVIGTKQQGQHISICFIDPLFHRRGIGRKLFEFANTVQPVKQITVNSSSYAISFYQSLGFKTIANEQETNGLRYTPMKLEI